MIQTSTYVSSVSKKKKTTAVLLICLTLPFIHFNAKAQHLTLQPLGTYHAGEFGEGAAEIVAYDPKTKRVFSVNANLKTIDALDISDPESPTLAFKIDATEFGASANSVAVKNGLVAVAIQANEKTDPGLVVIYSTNGQFLAKYKTGALPDMVTFTPDGKTILVANEGEPNNEYTIDPEGSITIIDLKKGLRWARVHTAGFRQFNWLKQYFVRQGVRIYGPGATVAQDLEPEYITVDDKGKTAWVSLQENNAYAEIDIRKARVKKIVPFGYKKHFIPGNGLDASDDDDRINIKTWPVLGMYQPDAIASYKFRGKTFFVSANEGDARDYDGFSEEERIKDVDLDPTRFPNAADLQEDENLGRLRITSANGDVDNDGDFDVLFSYGARSFSIWNPRHSRQVFDSGDDFEKITAERLPDFFNSNNDDNDSFESRSDDKGPEPEGLALGEIRGRTYAFIGLERIGGIMIYDVTNPYHPTFEDYINHRDFSVDEESPEAGDLGPEGLAFISGKESPTGKDLLVVGNEVSGTVTVYEVIKTHTSQSKSLLAEAKVVEQMPETESAARISIYPVPTEGVVTIATEPSLDVKEVIITSLTSLSAPMRYIHTGSATTVDLSEKPKGIYVARFYNSKHKLVNEQRIVKK